MLHPRPGPSGASTSPESGIAVSTEAKNLSSEKRQNVVDIFARRLFVVVLFLLPHFHDNALGASSPRVTLPASNKMMRKIFPLLALLCVFVSSLPSQEPSRADAQSSLPALTQPAFGEKLHVSGIPNAGKISNFLYRGAQPKEKGLSELKILGVTTIVDLRGEDRQKIEWERKTAESLGMRFVHIPVSGWAPPTNEQVGQFLALFRNDPGQKIFVHCRFGDDRTGVFVATYRMAVEKWSAEQAMKEMYFFGFNGLWHPAMKSFVREFPERMKSLPSLVSPQAQKAPS